MVKKRIEKLRILIVEDDIIAAVVIEKILQERGDFLIKTVSLGEEAIGVLEQFRPDLIILCIPLACCRDRIDTITHMLSRFDVYVLCIIDAVDRPTIELMKNIKKYKILIYPISREELFHLIDTLLKH